MNETMNSIEIAYNDDSFQMTEDTSGGLTEQERARERQQKKFACGDSSVFYPLISKCAFVVSIILGD